MKTSVAISWQETDFGAVAAGNAAELIGRAKSLGYDAIELAVRDPALVDTGALAAALGGSPVSAIGTGQAYLAEGLSLTAEDGKVRQATVERLAEHCRFAAKLGCFLVIVGLIRGKSGAQAYLLETLKQVCGLAKPLGVRLALEPINRYETCLVNTVEQGQKLIAQVGADNLGLLLDTFHMNIEEPCPATSIISSRERLWHMHFADSNRRAPGMGHLNFREFVELLRTVNYNGYVSAEIMPYPDAATAMETAIENMRRALGLVGT